MWLASRFLILFVLEAWPVLGCSDPNASFNCRARIQNKCEVQLRTEHSPDLPYERRYACCDPQYVAKREKVRYIMPLTPKRATFQHYEV